MAWADHIAYQPTISADLEAIRPLGDFVLVRPLSDEEGGKLTGTSLAELSSLSEFHMTADYRYRWNRPRGNRFGRVIAAGPGDRMVGLMCPRCYQVSGFRLVHIDAVRKRASCRECGSEMKTAFHPDFEGPVTVSAPMYCAPGDIVVFPQVPANEIEINGEKLIFLHQEQHVLAVLEGKESAEVSPEQPTSALHLERIK